MNRKINKKSFPIFLVGLILCAAFCLPAAAQKPTPKPTPRASPTITPLSPSSKNQGKLPFAIRDNSPMSSVNVANYQKLAAQYETERSPELRNRLIFMAVSQIDLHFRSNERKVRHRNRIFQTVLDILEVGAATAISITNGERAKTIIADGLGFIQGSRESIDKNYRMLDRQILVNKMVQKRANVLAAIYERVDKPDEEYPFERAFIDILDYFEAGRIDSALTELAKDSGSSAVNAEDNLKKAKRDADIRLASSGEQIRISKANSKIIQAIADGEDAARIKAGEANTKIAAANAKIREADTEIREADAIINSSTATAEEKQQAETEKTAAETEKTAAETEKTAAETEKTAAETEKTAATTKYKKIVKAIDKDPMLSVLLDELPGLYEPEDVEEIERRVARVRAGTASAEEYGLVLLRFYGRITELVGTDEESVKKATEILKSVEEEEEQNDGN